MFQYCPACASPSITFKGNRFTCGCGFEYYHNTAAAVGCVIKRGGEILLLTRDNEPSFGMLDLPGGFVDPGEGAVESLLRELREELGWSPEIPPGLEAADVVCLFASFPNVYPYKGIVYNTCDLFFTVNAPLLDINELIIDTKEISGVCFMRPDDIDESRIAFPSIRRAIAAFRHYNALKT